MPTIIYESEHQKNSIKHTFIAMWLIMGLGLLFISLFTVATFNSDGHEAVLGRKHSALNAFFTGLKHFKQTQFNIFVILFIVSFTIIFLLVTNYVKNRLIVVKIEFDDEARNITVYTTKYNNKLISKTYEQEKLLYRNAKAESDGVAGKFKSIKLIYEKELVGRIFLEHFTWTKSANTDNMIAELKQRIRLTKRYY
jgi:hypothetical protein